MVTTTVERTIIDAVQAGIKRTVVARSLEVPLSQVIRVWAVHARKVRWRAAIERGGGEEAFRRMWLAGAYHGELAVAFGTPVTSVAGIADMLSLRCCPKRKRASAARARKKAREQARIAPRKTDDPGHVLRVMRAGGFAGQDLTGAIAAARRVRERANVPQSTWAEDRMAMAYAKDCA